jgi:hypothetical protein
MLQLSNAGRIWAEEKQLISKWPFLYEIWPSWPVPKEYLELADIRTNKPRSAQYHCTSHSPLLFLVTQKHQGYTTCCPREEMSSLPAAWDENSDQWVAKIHWMLHHLGSLAKKGIYWPICMAYLLSLAYSYSLIDRPWCLELSQVGVRYVAAHSLCGPSWTLLIKLKISPFLCLSTLEIFKLFTFLYLNMA